MAVKWEITNKAYRFRVGANCHFRHRSRDGTNFLHMIFIYCDESDKNGEFYANFYGGMLIKSSDHDKVIDMMKGKVEELGLVGEEIKWQKVNGYCYEKYCFLGE